jgi:hypothetical protein
MNPVIPSIALSALFAAALVTTSAAGQPLTWQEHSLERLSFVAPADEPWTMETGPGEISFNKVELEGGVRQHNRYLRVMSNTFDEKRAAWSAQRIANDFRELEEEGMREMGVKTGMYRFRSLARGEETRSGRTLYTLKMVMRGGRSQGWALQRQELYLLFPRDHPAKRDFYMILIGDFCLPERCKEPDLSVAELLPMLDQLKLRDEPEGTEETKAATPSAQQPEDSAVSP